MLHHIMQKNPCNSVTLFFLFFLSPADAEQVAAHSPQLEGSAIVLTCPGAVSEATVPVSTETTQGKFFCC